MLWYGPVPEASPTPRSIRPGKRLPSMLKFSATLYDTIQPLASDQDIRISDIHQVIIPEEVPS
jgi:hypothetical protein